MFASCAEQDSINNSDDSNFIDYQNTSAYSEDGHINVVIEIPAGTNHKIEYDKDAKEFKIDQKDGKDRVVDFLPYPGNYGFIPSTYMAPSDGGDGDALDILVIAESLPTGTIVETIPIAVLMLKDGGEIDIKILAVPADENLRIINADNLSVLESDYPKVLEIITDRFLNYKGVGIMVLEGIENEFYALEEIEKWLVK